MPAAYLLVNFGGPRDPLEIEPFLRAILCDRDVIRTKFPDWLHKWLFGRIAKKRALKIREDYERIGFSPIYEDTEKLREALERVSGVPVLTFHRYLPATHTKSLHQIEACERTEIRVLPLFPQFCYGTTGSVARFFSENLPNEVVLNFRWVKSYADHPSFIEAWQKKISGFLKERNLGENDTYLLFSAHGVPLTFIDEGDPYKEECERSFLRVMEGFPKLRGHLAYQSKFGRGEWLRPYTEEECKTALQWAEGRKEIVIVPISFTSDHIETLYEIEELYLPLIRSCGMNAHRCPALNLECEWVKALRTIAECPDLALNDALIRLEN
jgi:protoporphyrin/coproporphyrin ferrochelatase